MSALGRKGDKRWRDALMVAVMRTDDGGQTYLSRIAKRCVEAAADGDMSAIKEIGDRIDGKPAQQLVHEGGDEPVKIVAVWGSSEPAPRQDGAAD